MSEKVSFTLLQIVPDRLRGEVLNVGIVLHTQAGPDLRLRMLPSRLRALAPSYSRANLDEWHQEWLAALQRFDRADQRWSWLKEAMAPLRLSETGGTILVESASDLEVQVERLLERLVMPPRIVIPTTKPRVRRSGLNAQLTSWLRAQHLYSPKLQDLSKHRVVSGYPLSISEELFAEFALKNGAIHVIETLDLRGHHSYTKPLRNEASHKALVLDLAQDELQNNSQRIAVIAADDYVAMKPAVSMLNRKASAVVSMHSATDRQWLADFVSKSLHLSTLLTPIPETIPVVARS
jgi:Protein of unknown function (DUF3037)